MTRGEPAWQVAGNWMDDVSNLSNRFRYDASFDVKLARGGSSARISRRSNLSFPRPAAATAEAVEAARVNSKSFGVDTDVTYGESLHRVILHA